MRHSLARHNLRVISENKRGTTPSQTIGKAAKPRKTRRRETIFRLSTPDAQDRRPRTPHKTHAARTAVALHGKKANGAPRKIAAKPDRITAKPDRIAGITTLPRAEFRAPSGQRAAMTALVQENNTLRRQNRELKATLQFLQRQLRGSDVNRLLALSKSLEAANRELREEIKALRDRAATVTPLAPNALPRRENPSVPSPLVQAVPEPDRETEHPAPPPVAIAPENEGTATADIYDSLFTGQVDTPDVIPDPAVWNIIQAGVPEDYAIPDPEFTEELARGLAEEQLGRMNAS